jgi:hypothetical protein
VLSALYSDQIYAQTSLARDNTVIQLRDNDWWYYGFGRGSEMVTLQDIKKIKDEKPVKQKLLDIGFGEKTKDKLQKKDIEFEGFENSSIIRIVMYDKESKTVLANMAYRKISDTPLRFIPDTKVSQDSQAKYSIQVVDSTKYESLKWATIVGYYSALQMLQYTPAGKQAIDEIKKKQNPKTAGTLQQYSNGCGLELKHDMHCSPAGTWLSINQIVVVVPCYGTSWVDVVSCCQSHDVGYWCASNYSGILASDITMVGCVFGKIVEHITNTTPWYCGGVVVGAIAGVAEATAVSSVLLPVMIGIGGYSAAVNDPDYVYGGYDKNSCLCGGTTPTWHKDLGQMCSPEITISGHSCIVSGQPNTFSIATNQYTSASDAVWYFNGVAVGSGGSIVFAPTQSGQLTAVRDGCVIRPLNIFTAPAQPAAPIIGMINDRPCRGAVLSYGVINQSCSVEYTWRDDAGTLLGIGDNVNIQTGASQLCVNVTATNTVSGLSTTSRHCFDLTECSGNGGLSVLRLPVLESKRKNIVRLIPSPASDELTIECTESGWMKAQIINGLGQILSEVRFKDRSVKMDVSRMMTGAYTVRVINEQGRTTIQPLLIAK